MDIRYSVALGLLLCCSCNGSSNPAKDRQSEKDESEETVVIPLDSVWAYMMPSTLDITLLETRFFTEDFAKLPSAERRKQFKESLVRKICKELRRNPKNGAKPGFAVSGSGINALNKGYEVLSGSKPVQGEFLAGDDISLFFFSYQAASNVQIQSINRIQNTFHIRFVHVPHMTLNMSEHFALIPAGNLPPGEYQVSIDWYDSQGKQVDHKDEDRVACQSFSFTVNEQPEE